MKFKIGQTVRIALDGNISGPGIVVGRCFPRRTYEISMKDRYQHEFIAENNLIYLTPDEVEVHETLDS